MAGTSGELSRRVVEAAGDAMVIVALGGGSDSAALLAAAAEALPDTLIGAVFVHHGFEGSDLLEKAARATAEQLGVSFTVLSGPVDEGPDLEARARHVRFAAIDSFRPHGAVVMTGHTQDDQAETVLMRLAAGAGSRGLAGIPRERGSWRRPFLDVTRAELAAYAERRALTVADDPANDDPRFTRNRVRHEVVPVLDAQLPGDVRRGVARSARLLRADDEVLSQEAERIPMRCESTSVWIAAAPLTTAPEPLAGRAIQRAIRLLSDGYPGREVDVKAVLDTARSGEASSLTGGLIVTNEGARIRIDRMARPVPEPREILVGDVVHWGKVRFAVKRMHAPPVALQGGRFTVLSDDAVSGTLSMRAFEPGDRLDIDAGSTPVAELLRAHGVPVGERPVSPLVVDGGKIAAIVGVRTATWARPHQGHPVIVIEREVET